MATEETVNRWIAVNTSVLASQANLLEEILYALDAQSVTLSDACDTPLFEPGVNETPLWQQTHLQGLFLYPNDAQTSSVDTDVFADLHKKIQSTVQGFAELETLSFSFEIIENRDWVRECLDQFEPIVFSNGLRITPSWKSERASLCNEILLDPGLAFGTGTHATTYLCLDWLDSNRPEDLSIIDFGCGSGILGIAALALGAKFVCFVDNDPQALIATQQNLALNNIAASRFEVQLSSDLDSGTLRSARANYDLVLANILASTLIELKEQIRALCKPGGRILLSGILEDQGGGVTDAFAPYFNGFAKSQREEWLRIAASRAR